MSMSAPTAASRQVKRPRMNFQCQCGCSQRSPRIQDRSVGPMKCELCGEPFRKKPDGTDNDSIAMTYPPYAIIPRYRLTGRYNIASRIRTGPERCGSASFSRQEAEDICTKENRNEYGGFFWPSVETEAVAMIKYSSPMSFTRGWAW